MKKGILSFSPGIQQQNPSPPPFSFLSATVKQNISMQQQQEIQFHFSITRCSLKNYIIIRSKRNPHWKWKFFIKPLYFCSVETHLNLIYCTLEFKASDEINGLFSGYIIFMDCQDKPTLKAQRKVWLQSPVKTLGWPLFLSNSLG